MGWMKRTVRSDLVYEILVIIWLVASPVAIARWVADLEDPVTWAAFTAGVIGVIIGWLVVAPQQAAKGVLGPSRSG